MVSRTTRDTGICNRSSTGQVCDQYCHQCICGSHWSRTNASITSLPDNRTSYKSRPPRVKRSSITILGPALGQGDGSWSISGQVSDILSKASFSASHCSERWINLLTETKGSIFKDCQIASRGSKPRHHVRKLTTIIEPQASSHCWGHSTCYSNHSS